MRYGAPDFEYRTYYESRGDENLPRSWWSRILSIPGYAAGWLGDHLVNILIMVFVVLVATFVFPPL